MAASRGISGKALSLEIDGVAYEMDATNIVMDNEEADTDTVTFAEISETGGRQWFFEVTAIQSLASASFWRYLWENSGKEVNFTFKPEGNAVASADSPHFSGTLVVGPKPSLGGEAANGRQNRFTFETRFDIVGEPTLENGGV